MKFDVLCTRPIIIDDIESRIKIPQGELDDHSR